MRATIVVLIAISALVVAEAYPTVCEARGKKSAVKKTPKAAALPDDPYASEGKAAAEEPKPDGEAAATEPATGAAAAASALEGEGGAADGKEPGSFLQQGEGEQEGGKPGSVRRSNRMEFDERLVKGQAAKSGAVYLFERAHRRLPGLVPMRRSYRKRIVEPVLGERELKPAVYFVKKPPEAPVVEPEAAKSPEEEPPEVAPAERSGKKGEEAKGKPKR